MFFGLITRIAAALTCLDLLPQPLRDDGWKYAVRLREAGVPVNHVDYKGCTHGSFISVAAAPEVFVITHDAMQALGAAFGVPLSATTAKFAR